MSSFATMSDAPNDEADLFHVFIKTLAGKTITVDLTERIKSPFYSPLRILHLKALVKDMEGIEISRQMLLTSDNEVRRDWSSLAGCNIKHNSILQLVVVTAKHSEDDDELSS
jgi:hypothetical protein